MISDNDEDKGSNQNWNKLNDTAAKFGYRDGISAGRDSNYQKSFDDGYREGFKNGFVLGQYKGVLSLNVNDVEKITRGNCEFCKNKQLEDSDIATIIDVQTKSSDCLLEKLHGKYSKTVMISLKNKLN